MVPVVVICAGLLTTSVSELSEYQAAAAKASRDPQAHLELAIWCEAHGMEAERLKHLTLASSIDPHNAAARGMMGLVPYRGQWLPPEKLRNPKMRNACRVDGFRLWLDFGLGFVNDLLRVNATSGPVTGSVSCHSRFSFQLTLHADGEDLMGFVMPTH